jgi:16S rRNA (uracil1498-N3)-methyltransferase
MSERFFASTPIRGDRATLEGSDAHHLAHVMRAKMGETVVLFDGSGVEYEAQIEAISKSNVQLAILAQRAINRESKLRLTLAVALPKGERQQWLVEKAVELGVAAIVPIVAERSVAQPTASALARLRRTVIEASKQCGRNRLMEIAEPERWMQYAGASGNGSIRLIGHPGGKPVRDVFGGTTLATETIIAAIGPEGGFSNAEFNQTFAAGWQAIDLGPRILRVETAAIALAAWVTLSTD